VNLTLPSISYVVARSVPGDVIGRNNQLPWHLRTDLQRFKAITHGHAIVMGRKTYLSIGRPLPGRVNIVLSRQGVQQNENTFWQKAETTTVWAGNLESALFFADVISIAKNQKEFFVIGGAEMYAMFFRLFNKIHLTEVMTTARIEGDATFKFRVDGRRWSTKVDQRFPAGPHDDFPSRYRVLERKWKRIRYVEVDHFYTGHSTKVEWINRQLDLFRDYQAPPKSAPFIVPYQYKLFGEQAAA
jgi:dihydrofolate reductase